MPTRTLRSSRAVSAAALLFVSSSSVSGEVVRLAGSFNNWTAADDAFALKPTGNRLELVRFWECGKYEFKFVFDGSWNRHLGDAGEQWLTQPGGNIPLTIQSSGDYSIWLDVSARIWGMDKRPRGPHARFRIVHPTRRTCELDASISLTTTEQVNATFDWEIETKDGTGRASLTGRRVAFSPAVSAPHRIRLTMKEGTQSDVTEKTIELANGFECFDGRRDAAGQLIPIPMDPVDGPCWTFAYDLPGGKVKLEVRRVEQRGAGKQRCTGEWEGVKHLRQLFVFDDQTGNLTHAHEAWRRFAYDSSKDSRLPKDLKVERVDLVGSFNNWSVGATPLLPSSGDEFYRTVALGEGKHLYKYVINGALWLTDPDPDVSDVPDGQGGRNSIVRVGPDAARLGTARPNDVNCAGVGHGPSRPDFFRPIEPGLAQVVLRVLHDDADSVSLRPWKRDDAIPMHRTAERDGFDYWMANFSIGTGPFRYTFELLDGKSVWMLDAGQCAKMPGEREPKISLLPQPFEVSPRMSFVTPDWAKRVVWYQIFPERFANGDAANDPPRTVPWTHHWYKPYQPKDKKKGAFGEKGDFFEYIFDRRYGGDLQGVRQRLGYLRDLGITAIYFNPIFQAESLHKYDASDYRHIDDYFGVKGSLKKLRGETTDPATWQWSETDRVFLDFLKEAHRLGFKVVLDGVFNHVGRDFWAFRDVLKHKEKSAYAGWFDITSWKPFHYAAWDKPDGSLPRLKHDEALGLAPPVREHLFAVTRRWMDPDGDGDPSDGIDGWRLDVAGDINANFWRDWRKLVKSINPNAYIVAELWQESKVWLTGDTFDAVMNYPFAVRCQRFFINKKKRIKPTEFDKQLAEILSWYPVQVNYVLQNLFDSHDTDRVASMFMNPDLEYDQANRQQDNGPKYNPSKPTPECYQRLKLLATFQMTFLGAPMIYYGDEAGMYGADDPSDRKPMLWKDLFPYDDPDERIEEDVLAHYRWAIAVRNSYPSLQLGTFQTLMAKDSTGVFAFARSLDHETVVVVINNSAQNRRLDVPVPWQDGSSIVQLDDPGECEIVDPPTDKPAARPAVRIKKQASKVRVEGGHLKGLTLKAYSASVFTKTAK